MSDLRLPTRRLDEGLKKLLAELKAGETIRVIQTVRVGRNPAWQATATGIYRGVNYLSTGLATERLPEDDIVVPIVHFTKPNGELSSISIDENTKIERVEAAKPA